jgi:hypothetical protein
MNEKTYRKSRFRGQSASIHSPHSFPGSLAVNFLIMTIRFELDNPTANVTMKSKMFVLLALTVLGALNAQLSTANAQGTAFTYQGQLQNNGVPASGSYDLMFSLYNSSNGIGQVGGALTNLDVGVTNGLFTVKLDFGTVFSGNGTWLAINVRTNGGSAFTALSPRQALTPAPYAIFADTASNVSGTVSAAQISGALGSGNLLGTYGDVVTFSDALNSFSGSFNGNGANVTNVDALALDGLNATNFWQLGGNNVLTGQFLGSVNNQAVEVRVNNTRVMRFEPSTNLAPNVIGGANVNYVMPGLYGNTIAGGGWTNTGTFPGSNSITGTYGDYGSIGGGYGNSIQNCACSTIGGGSLSLIQGASYSTIGGGQNTIGSYSDAATISGGLNNSIDALSGSCTIGGGQNNECTNWGATIGGGGYDGNTFMGNFASGAASTIGGGLGNSSVGEYAVIGGGYANSASGPGAFIGGGGNDGFVVFPNVVPGFGGVIGGGVGNSVSGIDSVIGGGLGNAIDDMAQFSFIGGGFSNMVSTPDCGVVGGGADNISSGAFSTVPGGYGNLASGEYSLAGGNGALAAHQGAFVWADSQSGSFSSTGANQFCVRAGGGIQLDGSTSLNFGATARQMLNLFNSGSINYGIGVQSSTLFFRTGGDDTANGFAWYRGGAYNSAQNNSGGGATLMTLNNAGLTVNGTFVSTSDRNAKEDFARINPQEVLDKVAALPITKWIYKTDTGTRHIGPMAQDFYAAFAVGPDDKHITTVDEGGVALAAIQGLNQRLEETRAENTALKQSVEDLKNLVQSLTLRK